MHLGPLEEPAGGRRRRTGATLAAAVAEVGEVAEGVVSAEPLVSLAAERGVELPICEQVAAMVGGLATPAGALAALTSRPARDEAEPGAG